MAETRRDHRAPISLKARFKSATIDEFIEHYSFNLSSGGVFVASEAPLAVGTLLKFQLQLKNQDPLIKGVGRVVWRRTEPVPEEGAEPPGMGIKFIKMDPGSRDVLSRVLESKTDSVPEGTSEDAAQVGDGGNGASADGFFPEPEPGMQNDEPEEDDRTAVRHASEFLASVLSGASSDEGAVREAEERAARARARTAQIEAERFANQAGAEPVEQEEAATMIVDVAARAELAESTRAGGSGGGPVPRGKIADAAVQVAPVVTISDLPPGDSLMPPENASTTDRPAAVSEGVVSEVATTKSAGTAVDRSGGGAPAPLRREPAREPGAGRAVVMLALVAAVVAGIYFLGDTKSGVPVVETVAPPGPPVAEVTPGPVAAPTGEAAAIAQAAEAASAVAEAAPAGDSEGLAVAQAPEAAAEAAPAADAPQAAAEAVPAEQAPEAAAEAAPVAEAALVPVADTVAAAPTAQAAQAGSLKLTVRTIPSPAMVNVGSKRGVSPAVFRLDPSSTRWTIFARTQGYEMSRRLVRPVDFKRASGAVEGAPATLTVTLRLKAEPGSKAAAAGSAAVPETVGSQEAPGNKAPAAAAEAEAPAAAPTAAPEAEAPAAAPAAVPEAEAPGNKAPGAAAEAEAPAAAAAAAAAAVPEAEAPVAAPAAD